MIIFALYCSVSTQETHIKKKEKTNNIWDLLNL